MTSQTHALKGIVRDSLQNSIPFVSIIAKPDLSNMPMKFTMSDDKGRYNLELVANVIYQISVSHLGYNSLEFKFNSIKNTQKNILLVENLNQLDEIIIELPILVKRDTIIYNVSKFVNGEEQKLKDVLRKLPGIEVSKNGEVTSNGKVVTHLLVEGKNFFGGNSKLAVENIPADAIKKVEVIDDYNEVALLKGLEDSDKLAMNIKLKEGKKNFLFGDVEIGKGNKRFYKSHSNLFYYNPSFNINFIGNINNVGEKTFTFKDYLNFKGTRSSVFKMKSYDLDLKNMSQFMGAINVVKTERSVAALNISKSIDKKLDVTGYLIYSHSNSQSNESITNQYVIPNKVYVEDLEKKEVKINDFGIAKLAIKYRPNSLESGNFNFHFKSSNSSMNSSLLSQINSEKNTIEDLKENASRNVNTNLEWHKKVSKKHILSLNSSFVYDKNNPYSVLESDQLLFQDLINLLPAEKYMLISRKKMDNSVFSLRLKYYWVLNRKVQIATSIGNEKRWNDFITTDSQLSNNNYVDFSDSNFNNNLTFKLNESYIGIAVKYRTGKFQFKPSVYLQKYYWSVKQSNYLAENKLVVLPGFVTKWNLSQTDKIKLTYKLQSAFPGGASFSNKFYINSYNQINIGNEHIENELQHFSSLYYTTTNLYRRFFLLAEVNFIKKIKGLQTVVETMGRDNYVSMKFVDEPSERMSGVLIINKSFKDIKYQLRGRVNSFQYVENVNSNLVKNKHVNSLFKFSVKSLHKGFPSIEMGYKQGFSNYVSGRQTLKFSTYEPYVTFNYKMLNKINFLLDYSYYIRKNNALNKKDTYHTNKLIISYKEGSSSWEFKCSLQNILNNKSQNKNSFNSYIISDTKSYILPRIGVFSVIYKL